MRRHVPPCNGGPTKEVGASKAREDDFPGDLAEGLLFLEGGLAGIRGKPLLDNLNPHNARSFLKPARNLDTRPGL